MQIHGEIFAMQLYWNHTSAWVTKSAAFLQNIFSVEDIWRTASGQQLHYNKKHIYIEHIFFSIY